MSSPNNRVFQILVTKGNKNLLAAGSYAEALAPDQLGIFNADTGKSLDAATVSSANKLYLSLGIDQDGDGSVEDFMTSANEYFLKKNITAVTKKEAVDPVDQVITVTDYKSCCNSLSQDYVLKITLTNEEILRTLGNVAYTKTFVAHPNCGSDCASIDINEITKQLVDSINADPSGLFSAVAIDENGSEITDLDAYIAANSAVNTDDDPNNDVGSGIKITVNALKTRSYCAINLKYFNPRGTSAQVVATGAFECCGTKVTEVTPLTFGQGSGYDIQHMEYIANGWNKNLTSTIRVSAVTGLPIQEGNYRADVGEKYVLYNIEYSVDMPHITSPMGGYNKTLIAVPVADTTTIADLDAVFAALGFNL